MPKAAKRVSTLAEEAALEAVLQERERQNEKWGEQNHDAGIWALILLEEIGEWAKAELDHRLDRATADAEAVQVAAVALACPFR